MNLKKAKKLRRMLTPTEFDGKYQYIKTTKNIICHPLSSRYAYKGMKKDAKIKAS